MRPLPKPTCILTVDLVDGSDTCEHREIELKGDSVITIGRSSSDLSKQLVAGEDNFWLSSQVVSRKHATVSYKQVDDDYKLILEDSNSTHGTYVESFDRGQHKLTKTEQHIVNQGDRVQFGLKMTKEGKDHHPPIFEMNFVEHQSPFDGAQPRSHGYGYQYNSDSEIEEFSSQEEDRAETDEDSGMGDQATPESGNELMDESPWSSPARVEPSSDINSPDQFTNGVPATPLFMAYSQSNPSLAVPMNSYHTGLPPMSDSMPNYADFTSTNRNISLENDGFELLRDAPSVFRFTPAPVVVDLTSAYPPANSPPFPSSATVNTNLTSISIPNLLNNNNVYSEAEDVNASAANARPTPDSDDEFDLAFENEAPSMPSPSPQPVVRSLLERIYTPDGMTSNGLKRKADHLDWESDSDDESYGVSEMDTSSEDDESFTSDPPSPMPGSEEEAMLAAREKEYLEKKLAEKGMTDAVVQTTTTEGEASSTGADSETPRNTENARGHPEQRPAKRARTALMGVVKVGAIFIAGAAAAVASMASLPDGFFLTD